MYKIFVDSGSNIPAVLVEKYRIEVIPFINLVDGKEVLGFTPGLTEEQEREKGTEYYNAIRKGAQIKTSLISSGRFEEIFRKELENGYDVLYLSISSGISGCYQASKIAAEELNEEFTDVQVYCVDSMNASLATGNLAIYASIMRDKNIEVTAVWHLLEKTAHCINGVFTVDDLKYLAATGRIHGGVATVGQMMKIKPILMGNAEGYIVNFKMCHGRKKALNTLVDIVCENAVHPEKQIFGIAQADAYEESLKVIEKINERVHFKEIINTSYDFCTGSHVGPGTIAVFFLAKDRSLDNHKDGSEELEIFEYID